LGCNTPRNIDEVAFYALRKDKAALLRILTGDDKAKRIAAACEIIKLEDDADVHAALRKAMDDDDLDVRKTCALAYMNYQFTNREGYNNIQTAIQTLTPAARSDFLEVLEKRFGPNGLEWWQAIADEFDIQKSGKRTLVEVPTPNWGSGGKIATAAVITALTGNVNAGVGMAGQMKITLNEHIKIPPLCHVCGIGPPTHAIRIEKTVSNSLVGTVIAGSLLGDLTLQMKIPVCARCAGLNRKAIVSIAYYERLAGKGKVLFSIVNPKIAEQYAELNQGKILPPGEPESAGTPAVEESTAIDLSAGAADTATLRIRYPGADFITDGKIDVFFDGKPIGVGSSKKGMDLTVKTATGKHKLMLHLLGGLRKKEYSIDLSSAVGYEAHLTYSKAWGNFSNDLLLRNRADAGEGGKTG
jgi:hypothetical protein